MTLAAALTRAARFGGYFEVGLDGAVPEFDLDRTLTAVAARLGTAESRVAASSLQYEFAERLWAVSLGAWAFGRIVPDLTGLRYGAGADGRLVLGFADLRGTDCLGATTEQVAELLAHNVISQLEVFHETVRTATKIADGLLWGNAATALVLSARSASRGRSCYAVASALLAQPPLLGRVIGPITTPKRRSCCLFYRTAAGRKCGDCPL